MRKFFVTLLCCFVPDRKLRHALRAKFRCDNKKLNLKLVVIENGVERKPTLKEWLSFSIHGSGQNNVVTVKAPVSPLLRLRINFANSDDNVIYLHENVQGPWSIGCYDFGNRVEIGKDAGSSSVFISCIGHTVKIGHHCMFSNNIHIWGDGHSVLDFNTGEVLNKPNRPIVVGDHCWIGERVTLTKNAQLPNDCIVGIASVVTKKFTEEHSVLAGAPAKVVKTGITWAGASPLTYENKVNKQKS